MSDTSSLDDLINANNARTAAYVNAPDAPTTNALGIPSQYMPYVLGGIGLLGLLILISPSGGRR